MYTRMYHLDSKKYTDINNIKSAVLDMKGVSEVKIINETNSLVVQFDNTLSEKQVLSTINQFKQKTHKLLM